MQRELADLLIEARWVLPIAPASAALAHHAVAVVRGRIAAIGPAAQLAARYDAGERVLLRDHALLPGFVNAHTRIGRRLLRGRGAAPSAKPLAEWASADLVHDGAQLAIAEMLRAGITAFGSRDPHPEEVARVAASARIRASVGLPIAERATGWAEGMTGHLARAEALWDEYKADPWVALHFAPDAGEPLADAALARVRTVADELDARIAMPVHETPQEIERHVERHGTTPLRRLDALGLLRPGFTAVHLNRLEEAELELARRQGIAVAACPQSSLRRGLGVCPLGALSRSGIPVGLGSGSPAATFALDVLAEARAAALAASAQSRLRDALDAHRALELATLGGAAALGLKGLIGSIEPGKAADLIALDLSPLACRPGPDPAEAILYGASRERVSHVWINGAPRVMQGRLLAFDESELAALAERWESRL